MEYLVAQGHRRIGYIHGIESTDDAERYRAYLDVMAKYNLPVEENFILDGYFEEIIAFNEISKMLLQGKEMPDAFFCANDEMAWGCIRALSTAKVSVPEQVSVLGFENSVLAEYYRPGLTTVGNPVTEMGSKSARELLRMIKKEGDSMGRSVRLAPTLIERESCQVRLDYKE
jgi:LacI family purine nucleotide synthesis repressor